MFHRSQSRLGSTVARGWEVENGYFVPWHTVGTTVFYWQVSDGATRALNRPSDSQRHCASPRHAQAHVILGALSCHLLM